MSTQMSVAISRQSADSQWGENAILSFGADGAIIHTSASSALDNIQRAGRKLDSQGIKQVALNGEHWDIESIWAFIQGFRSSKKATL